MTERLTRWEGQDENGPRAVLAGDGRFPDLLQAALRKLARLEDAEESRVLTIDRDVLDDERYRAANEAEKSFRGYIKSVEAHIYDQEEIFPDCTVQILTNTVTGDVSVGWWPNEGTYDA